MNGEVDLGELFFSARGRAPRGPFLIAVAVLRLATVFYESAVTAPVHWLTGVLFYPALMFRPVCVVSKRLHDRGRSGWWAAPLLRAVLMVWPHQRLRRRGAGAEAGRTGRQPLRLKSPRGLGAASGGLTKG